METRLRTDSAGRVRFSDDMVGFQLIGDGEEIGKIDHASYDGSWATVAVGRLRKARYAVPAWTIDDVDPGTEIVAIGVAKDDVLESPEYESGVGLAEGYQERVNAHYRKRGDEPMRKTA